MQPANTGTAIGLVSNVSGEPVDGLRIYGMEKDPTWGYGWNESYCCVELNGDDIFDENFGTTDVTPGTYRIKARQTNGTLYQDMGWHTFEGGMVTFIGLNPVYLPDIRNSGGWNTPIKIRNNSATDTARVITTFFKNNGRVRQQRTDMLSTRQTLTINPPSYFTGS